MKNVNKFSRSMSFPSETFKLKRNKIDIINDFDINNKIEKDKKINNSFNESKSLKDNNDFSVKLSNLNNYTNKENIDVQSELDNFNIDFFLPNISQKNFEEVNAANNSNKDHFNNIAGLNNQKDVNFNNNYFMNNISIKKEEETNISKSINKFCMTIGESYKDKNDNSYQKVNNLSIDNKDFFNITNPMITPPQNINNIINNNKEMLYDTYDLNNNYLFNINNSDLKNINFIYQGYNQNEFQFNNNNIDFLPKNNPKIIFGNNLQNYQNLNKNNFIYPINQFNFNANQVNSLNYENPCSNFNNTASTKNYSRKIIDDYTLEMFGRRGWICLNCNNFNYEARKKCNRCHIIKVAKKVTNKQDLFSERKSNTNHKFDWICKNCGNFNYSFRTVCNLCKNKKCI